ncbi:MAG: RNA polymerase sigma factor [Clostridia bacterium]|nr:RNA polymerase sigma factor [Clostridia bacterium]
MTNRSGLPDMEKVYNEYFSPVYNYVFYKLLNRENTEDVVSQIFMKVCSHLSSFDPARASLKTWIFRITDHALIDFYRKQRPSLSFDNEESGLDNVLCVHFDEQYDRQIGPERQAVLAALRQLPERDRTFIYYKYYLNITNREIARRMGMNENTVSAVIARARQKLRGILAEEV